MTDVGPIMPVPRSDEDIRLEALRLAVAAGGGRHVFQLLKDAGDIESHIRYGRLKNEQGHTTLAPECFIGEEGTVISLQGENFYKACGHWVSKKTDGGSTHCVKRVNHPSPDCEDFDGRTYNREL